MCSLYETIESLESRCEDLQHLVDDMGHLKKDDSVVTEGSVSGSAAEDQDEYAKLVSQLEHAKNQRAKEQRKVSELEQNVSLLIQVKTMGREWIKAILVNTQYRDEPVTISPFYVWVSSNISMIEICFYSLNVGEHEFRRKSNCYATKRRRTENTPRSNSLLGGNKVSQNSVSY